MTRKKKQSPAAIAESIAKYIAKQEETLKRYPVGPMANSARINLRKGQAALKALQGKNEQMKQQMEGQLQQKQGAVPQFAPGGYTDGAPDEQAVLDAFTMPGQRRMYETFTEMGYHPDVALAITSISAKESGGDFTKSEGFYYSDPQRFKDKFAGAANMTTEEIRSLMQRSRAGNGEEVFGVMYGPNTKKGKELGNKEPGDGYKYRGRGMFQLTGRDNYAKFGKWAKEQGLVDDADYFLKNPDALLEEGNIGPVSQWYMTENGREFKDYTGIDDFTEPLTDEAMGMMQDAVYAKVAGKGSIQAGRDRDLYSEGMPKMRDWTNSFYEATGGEPRDYAEYDGNFIPVTEDTVRQEMGLAPDTAVTPEIIKDFQRQNGMTGAAVDGQLGPNTTSYHATQGFRSKQQEFARLRQELAARMARRDRENFIEGQAGDQASVTQQPDETAVAGPGTTPTTVDPDIQRRVDVLEGMPKVPQEPYVHRQTLPEVVIQAPRPPVTPIEESQPMNRFYPGQDLGPPTPPPPAGTYPIMQIPGSLSEGIRLQEASAMDKLGPGLVPNELPQQRLRMPLVNAPTEPVMPSTPPTRREQRQARRDQRRDDRAAARMQPMPTPLVPPTAPGNMAAALMDPQLMASAFRQGLAPQLPMFYDGGYTKDDLSFAGREWDLDNTQNDELLLDMNGRPAIVRDGRTGRIIHLTKGMYFAINSAGSQQAVIDSALGRSGSMVDTGDVNLSSRDYPEARVTDMYLEDIGADTFETRPSAATSAPAEPAVTQPRLPNQPVATRTTYPTGYEAPRAQRRGQMELYDVHGNLQGTYVGAGNIRTSDGDGRNIYNRAMREREAFYDKDGNLIGTYQGGGQFGGGRDQNPGVMAGQALQRYVQGAGENRRQTTTNQPGNASTGNMAGSSTLDEEQAREEAAAAARAGAEETGQQEASTTDLRELPAGLPDTYNLNMGNANLINAIPAAASLASVPIMRDAVNSMERPPQPQMAQVPRFNYRSNVGQQLQDARTGVNALSRNTNLSSGQQAANRQGLLAQRFRQENRLYNLDSAEYARQRNAYDQRTQQARLFNTQLRNKYAQDMQAFNNQMNLYDAQLQMQPLNVLSTSAQDYLKNVYAPSQAVALAGVGRNFNTDLLEDTQNGAS